MKAPESTSPRACLAASVLLVFAACAASRAAPSDAQAAADANAVFAGDAAWCWFSDPRALIHDGKLYAGWIDASGSVQVGVRDLASADASTAIATLAPEFERDDHDHPALLALPNGNLAAFYAPHASGDLRAQTAPFQADGVGAWSPARELGFGDFGGGPRGVTYANPFLLSDESNALYLFWRGTHFKPSFAVSRDLGATWGEARTLIAAEGSDDGVRPYVKYAGDGHGRIDFLFTDGHPRNEPTNSVYYLRYANGQFTKADGTVVGGMEDLPFAPAQCDRIYDGAAAGRAWIWSIGADDAGRPVVVYTRLPSETDHRYHYARWDGTAWQDSEIVPAGKWFPETPAGQTEREPHYSGGATLDPHDAGSVYLARPVDGVFEIERWTTRDGGSSWKTQAITTRSTANNVRPYAVANEADGSTVVLWMHASGGYRHYTDFQTELRFATAPSRDQ